MADKGETSRNAGGAAADLDAMNVAELRALIEAAQAKAAEKVEAAKAAVLARTRAELAELGVSLDSLLRPHSPQGRGKGKRPAGDGKLPVKYRGPDGQEWSGRGKVPLWLGEAEKQGRGRDEFLVRKAG